jgi:hypothetical protein
VSGGCYIGDRVRCCRRG